MGLRDFHAVGVLLTLRPPPQPLARTPRSELPLFLVHHRGRGCWCISCSNMTEPLQLGAF